MSGTDYVCGGCGHRIPAEKDPGLKRIYRHVDKCEPAQTDDAPGGA